MLGDVSVLQKGVPDDVKRLQTALRGSIPMTRTAAESVQVEAQRLVSYARRLRALPARFASMPALDTATLVRSMKANGVEPNILLDAHGRFSFGVGDVDIFLDVIEGRYFEDDLGKEHRRADRYSRRQ